MKALQLTTKNLWDASLQLCELVACGYRPDGVVYIDRAGYPVAKAIARQFDVPLLGVGVANARGRMKQWAAPLLPVLPGGAKRLLRCGELWAKRHVASPGRRVYWKGSPPQKGCFQQLLVVDDSVDTGHTMRAAAALVQNTFPHSTVKTAALNLWRGSERVAATDFVLYHNTLLMTPMSMDAACDKQAVRHSRARQGRYG